MADSPHAEELLGAGSRLAADCYDAYDRDLQQLVAVVVTDARDRGEAQLTDIEPVEVADLGIALTKGLEGDLAAVRSGSHRDLVDLVSGMAGAVVDALYRFGTGRLGKAEHVPGVRIGPCVLEVDVLIALNIQVCLMRSLELVSGHAGHVGVDVHELCHLGSLRSVVARRSESVVPQSTEQLWRREGL